MQTHYTPVDGYYRNKENFIKYLSAWVQILKNEVPTIDVATSEDINSLKELLLNKLADQSFEEAAVLRDRINNLELKA